jgi:hypothetical protein
MPAAYKRCVKKVGGKKAHAICTAANVGGIKEIRKKEGLAKKAKGNALGR